MTENWKPSGSRLVARILTRRRRLCIRQGRHTAGRCSNCGVHQ